MKKLIIENDFWDLFPEASLAVLVTEKNEKNISQEELNEIKSILDKANAKAIDYLTEEELSNNPVIKVWREAYKKFPGKKGARCSVENLLKRVKNGNPVGTILPSVDITNAISLEYALPIGAEDIDKIDGNLVLGRMNGTEPFMPIGSEKDEPPLPGEIAYKDNTGVVCRCLNWRDGQRTQITDATTKEFIVMECLEKDRQKDLENALNDLEKYLTKYIGSKILKKEILTINKKEIVLEDYE